MIATLPLVPMTELDAVNAMLISIGEQPVNTLEATDNAEVSIARNVLHQVSRQTQAVGLLCNSEENYPLVVDVDGYIRLPANTLKVDATDSSIDVVMRGRRLYDRKNHTYKFKDTLNVDIVFFLPFEELPQVVRDYITIRATRVFQSNVVGSEILYEFTAKDEMDAHMAMVQQEVDHGDYNMLNNPDVQMMLRRR